VLEYQLHRECLEQAKGSYKLLPCSRLIMTTYTNLYNQAKQLSKDKIAAMVCQ